ncbi:tRNA lysidine(34) synthetase TilS [Deferribacter autotrophicus]|uniref:tRNA(Ile)-lysidine synthase n=1 Tax=Deferribacter autotrophicus TaxID=500465 RepID=A0A5A8F496_9BACT|nr:tRNA lysidine(34) synthetase TilS [Deferribacter autotrophicus]KAA0258179.1 tRNA lysidine(34) synthetase TilS [Deferribacter autotrophicus]
MNTLYEKKLFESCQILKDRNVIIALSGGKDSVSLLHFFKENQSVIGVNSFVACHINHHIRENSDADAMFCKKLCEEWGVKFYLFDIYVYDYVKNYNMSIEEAGRILRYEKLYFLLKELNYDFILTAHHKDDLIENFFIRVFRGTPIYNLSGFNIDEKIFRPLIDIEREEIEYYVNFFKIPFVEDITNRDERYLRNWIRNRILKEIKSYNKGFYNNIERLINESKELKNYLDKKVSLDYEITNFNFVSFELEKFNKLENYEKRYFLMNLLLRYIKAEKKYVDELIKIIQKKTSKRINLPNNFLFEKSISRCYLFKNEYLKSFEIVKDYGETEIVVKHLGKIVTFDNDMINKKLIVRNRRKGDKFKGKKLKDIFIDKKIDLIIRDTAILVEENGNIIWAEHISKEGPIKIKKIGRGL